MRRAGISGWFASLIAAALRLPRLIRNRRATLRLLDRSERELSDIGLSRRDVHDALAHPLRDDASMVLTRRRLEQMEACRQRDAEGRASRYRCRGMD